MQACNDVVAQKVGRFYHFSAFVVGLLHSELWITHYDARLRCFRLSCGWIISSFKQWDPIEFDIFDLLVHQKPFSHAHSSPKELVASPQTFTQLHNKISERWAGGTVLEHLTIPFSLTSLPSCDHFVSVLTNGSAVHSFLCSLCLFKHSQ